MEIEIKLKVESFAPTIAKLKSCDGHFVGDFLQIDSYYDDAQDSLVSSDRCLRIRKHINQSNSEEVIELTYKGQREDHRFKSRREIGLKVEKAKELAEIFSGLDYDVRLVFEKKRSIWNIDNCEVALDELPFVGKFIEIEGPDDETISKVQNKLGLDQLIHEPKSYAHIMEDKLKELGLNEREVTFKLAMKI